MADHAQKLHGFFLHHGQAVARVVHPQHGLQKTVVCEERGDFAMRGKIAPIDREMASTSRTVDLQGQQRIAPGRRSSWADVHFIARGVEPIARHIAAFGLWR